MTTQPNTLKIAASQREAIPAGDEAARAKLIERAVAQANRSAHQTAAALGMRILGVQQINKNLVELPGGEIEARVEAEYSVSGFSQARLDFKILRATGNLGRLLKKELSTRWFQFKLGLRLRFARKNAVVSTRPARALVAGHFSIPGGGGTFGDIEAQEMVCAWLTEAGIEFDVAANSEDGVSGLKLEDVDGRQYGIFIFVCGPWYPHKKIPALLLAKFAHCLKIGVDLTVYEAGNGGFDHLLSRDSLDGARADLAFARQLKPLPVVGVLLVERQAAYGNRQRHLYVKQIIDEYLETAEVVPLWLDTVAHYNKAGLATGREFESLVRKADLVITNRLHGLVLSLKNGVPVVAIDAVAGGGKVSAQARALNWPVLIPAEELTVERLREKVTFCLNSDLAADLRESGQRGRTSVEQTKAAFLGILQSEKSKLDS